MNFDHADLTYADMHKANLRGARNLSDKQLSSASHLFGAIMPDGKPYDGRYNLPGDLAQAQWAKVDVNDPQAMANFYGVSLETYLAGQRHGRCHSCCIGTGAWLPFALTIVSVVFAILSIRSKRLITSALWLAGVSALLSVVFYLFGAHLVAVVELSVGAGLVTVLFAFAISVAGDEPIDTAAGDHTNR